MRWYEYCPFVYSVALIILGLLLYFQEGFMPLIHPIIIVVWTGHTAITFYDWKKKRKDEGP